ncbi:hypothetical protein [Dongia sp.]|uniref:hypothetical protein n=1 Tax=Dongia sp. TaxID=1977262 RepID=UPI0035B48172
MTPREFVGQNCLLQPPLGHNESNPDIRCGALPIMRQQLQDGPAMISVWKPTEDELAQLNAGHAVRLVVYGTGHPPVWIDVAEAELLP